MNGKDLQPDYSEEARRRHNDAEAYEALVDAESRPGGEDVPEDEAVGRLRLTFRRWCDRGRNILVSGKYADSLSIIAAVIALAQEVLK